MKILIATSIYLPNTGGPAQYAFELNREFRSMGHEVKVVRYSWEKILPSWVKHFVYFLKLVPCAMKADFILALDTYLAAIPALWAGRLFGKKVLVRTGGDFFWEMYVNRTGQSVTLSEFYKREREFNTKEKIIFGLTRETLRRFDGVIFSTEYQREIFINAYNLKRDRTFIVENCYKEKVIGNNPSSKNFLWAGRDIPLKNVKRLESAFNKAKEKSPEISLDIMKNPHHQEFIAKLTDCYAFVLPSLSEVSPNTILRAISLNKPFVCTRETGIYDKIKDLGLFVDPLSEDDIREKILALSDDSIYDMQKDKLKAFTYTHSYAEIAQEILSIAASL